LASGDLADGDQPSGDLADGDQATRNFCASGYPAP